MYIREDGEICAKYLQSLEGYVGFRDLARLGTYH